MPNEYENAVKTLVDYVGQSVSFAKEQLPDVAKEILIYNATIDHYWLAAWLIMMVFGLVLFIVGLLTDGEGKQAFGGIVFVLCSVFAVCAYGDLVKIEQAPKLYILDELKARLPKCDSK
jgi:hypothetical protein